MPQALRLLSYAKINLGLEVLGKRSDGYHEVATVMQSVGLHDVLTISEAPDLTITGNPKEVPVQENLILSAARALRQASGTNAGAHFLLEKSIPIAAGIGGGSSNAAFALMGLNVLWKTGLTLDELTPLAAQLGADVPFFLTGGTAFAKGCGDVISALPAAPSHHVVLAMPAQSLATAAVYADLTREQFSNGSATMSVAKGFARGLLLHSDLTNSLQAPAVRLCPSIGEITAQLRKLGAAASMVSGSGSACFGLFHDRLEAERTRLDMARRGYWAATCGFVPAWAGELPAKSATGDRD